MLPYQTEFQNETGKSLWLFAYQMALKINDVFAFELLENAINHLKSVHQELDNDLKQTIEQEINEAVWEMNEGLNNAAKLVKILFENNELSAKLCSQATQYFLDCGLCEYDDEEYGIWLAYLDECWQNRFQAA